MAPASTKRSGNEARRGKEGSVVWSRGLEGRVYMLLPSAGAIWARMRPKYKLREGSWAVTRFIFFAKIVRRTYVYTPF